MAMSQTLKKAVVAVSTVAVLSTTVTQPAWAQSSDSNSKATTGSTGSSDLDGWYAEQDADTQQFIKLLGLIQLGLIIFGPARTVLYNLFKI